MKMQVTKEVLEQYQKDLAAAMQMTDDLAQLNELNEIEHYEDRQNELRYRNSGAPVGGVAERCRCHVHSYSVPGYAEAQKEKACKDMNIADFFH